jgi:hypothetical protein
MPSKKRSSTHYNPSWMDRFFDWVERLPLPFLSFYILCYVLIVLAQHAFLWLDDSLPSAQFAPIVFVQNVWFVFIPAFWHFVRRAGLVAMDRFRPALQLSEKEFRELKFRFTHLAPRTGWIITIIAVLGLIPIFPMFGTFFGPLFFSPYTWVTTTVLFFLIAPINIGAFYSVIRMLLSIDGLYAKVKRINLFNLTPLYALSTFTARVGLVFIFFLLLNLLSPYIMGRSTSGEVELFFIIFNGTLAVLAFVLPLLGVHRRLEAVKELAVEANNNLIEDGFAEIQALVIARRHKAVPTLRASNSALLEYRHELNRVSTWPWDAATLRGFVTALAVPMTVWIVQQVLIRTVGQ